MSVSVLCRCPGSRDCTVDAAGMSDNRRRIPDRPVMHETRRVALMLELEPAGRRPSFRAAWRDVPLTGSSPWGFLPGNLLSGSILSFLHARCSRREFNRTTRRPVTVQSVSRGDISAAVGYKWFPRFCWTRPTAWMIYSSFL